MLFFALIIWSKKNITQIILYSLLQFHLVNVKFDLNKAKVRSWFWPQILIEEKRSKALVKRVVLRNEEITRLSLCFTS